MNAWVTTNTKAFKILILVDEEGYLIDNEGNMIEGEGY